ncbi:MAG: glycosyltransferase family 2 protein [Bacilli bacterium]|nr:glycosyltransferase family 2 protein [Bacilli bacterium]
MMPILTIVVPSYKTAKFLNYTLPQYAKAVLSGLVRVAFIDDGSPDDTGVLLQDFAARHSKYCSYHKKTNGGHGSVINYALDEVIQTKYFRIVDGDDYIISSELCSFARALKEIDADIIIDQTSISELGSHPRPLGANYLKQGPIDMHEVAPSLAATTYKTEMWKTHNIKLTEHVYYEDMQYNLFPLAFAKTAYYLPFSTYVVVVGNATQSTAPENATNHLEDYCRVIQDIFIFNQHLTVCPPYYLMRSSSIVGQLVDSYVHLAALYCKTLTEARRRIALLKSMPFYREMLESCSEETKKVMLGPLSLLRIRTRFRAKRKMRNLLGRRKNA